MLWRGGECLGQVVAMSLASYRGLVAVDSRYRRRPTRPPAATTALTSS